MSVINSAFARSLAGEPMGSGSSPSGLDKMLDKTQTYAQLSDAVSRPSWIPPGGDVPATPYGGYAPAAGSNGGWNLASIMNFISSTVNGLFAQLGSLLSSTSGTLPASASPQTYFSDATASSTGDPHLALDGTTANGTRRTEKWDSMTSHRDLLDSDSFDGGYRVSTKVTAPASGGVTQNARAAVTTDGGATRVAMNADGSYDVRSNGASVALQTGVATQLDGGESVTLNADRSLTVTDDDGRGGSIATTLRANGGGGVDVSSSAHDVDLGGYLVNKSDAPVAPGPSFPVTSPVTLPIAYPQPVTYAQPPYESLQPFAFDDTTNVQLA